VILENKNSRTKRKTKKYNTNEISTVKPKLRSRRKTVTEQRTGRQGEVP